MNRAHLIKAAEIVIGIIVGVCAFVTIIGLMDGIAKHGL